MSNDNILPTVTITAKRTQWNFPQQQQSPIQPFQNMPNIDINRGQFTDLNTMRNNIVILDNNMNFFKQNIEFILTKLSDSEKNELSEALNELTTLEAEVKISKEFADKKFNESMTKLKLWNIYNDTRYQTDAHKMNAINVTLSFLDSNYFRRYWESNYGVARRNEIQKKQKLNEEYNKILNILNEKYLSKFYQNYASFPPKSKQGTLRSIQSIGAKNLNDGFKDDKVEIIISDSRLISPGSQFGHVAVNIGGIVYGRAPEA